MCVCSVLVFNNVNFLFSFDFLLLIKDLVLCSLFISHGSGGFETIVWRVQKYNISVTKIKNLIKIVLFPYIVRMLGEFLSYRDV